MKINDRLKAVAEDSISPDNWQKWRKCNNTTKILHAKVPPHQADLANTPSAAPYAPVSRPLEDHIAQHLK